MKRTNLQVTDFKPAHSRIRSARNRPFDDTHSMRLSSHQVLYQEPSRLSLGTGTADTQSNTMIQRHDSTSKAKLHHNSSQPKVDKAVRLNKL